MLFWISLLTTFSFVGSVSDRTFLHFSSPACSACQRMQPLMDRLHSEGWAIRSIDSRKDRASTQRWHVREIPTLIVLEGGHEVDRIVGALSLPELRKRLTRNEFQEAAANELASDRSVQATYGSTSNLGPNHPLSQSNFSSDSNQRKKSRVSLNVNQSRLIGPNHPFYSLYNPSRSDAKESVSSKSDSSTSSKPARKVLNPLLKGIVHPPVCQESMAATVRIRVMYPESESVGTGTIINTDGEQAVVLTCGHLFRNNETLHPVMIELFHEEDVVQLPGKVIDFQNGKIDLGLVTFRHSNSLTKVQIRPKNESLYELAPVYSIGCDHGDPPSRKDSVISKLNRYLGPSNIEIAGAPVQGRSGGGLFDAERRLIGVCYASDEELDEGLFVGLEAIYAHLEKNHLLSVTEPAMDKCDGKSTCPVR